VLAPDSKISRNEKAVARRLDEGEGGVILHLDTGAYHGVNEVGLLIWELLETEQTMQELVAGVRDRVDEPPPQLEDDVASFLADVQERDLIVVG
jgi:coenzyme PQQ synthesis protein D (PqqD)